jgi:hypothetical protein
MSGLTRTLEGAVLRLLRYALPAAAGACLAFAAIITAQAAAGEPTLRAYVLGQPVGAAALVVGSALVIELAVGALEAP